MSLESLRNEYDQAASNVQKYKRVNFIGDEIPNGDITYLKLVREKFLTFIAYKKLEVGESRWNSLFAPVYNKKLDDVENRLRESGVAL